MQKLFVLCRTGLFLIFLISSGNILAQSLDGDAGTPDTEVVAEEDFGADTPETEEVPSEDVGADAGPTDPMLCEIYKTAYVANVNSLLGLEEELDEVLEEYQERRSEGADVDTLIALISRVRELESQIDALEQLQGELEQKMSDAGCANAPEDLQCSALGGELNQINRDIATNEAWLAMRIDEIHNLRASGVDWADPRITGRQAEASRLIGVIEELRRRRVFLINYAGNLGCQFALDIIEAAEELLGDGGSDSGEPAGSPDAP
jgi:hypothetical protein